MASTPDTPPMRPLPDHIIEGLPEGDNLNVVRQAKRTFPSKPLPIDPNADMAQGCEEIRLGQNVSRCFDANCARCWNIRGDSDLTKL